MRPVAVVGSLSLDSVDGGPLRIGGGAFYGARALATLERPARVVARCADEDRAQLAPELAAAGVPATLLGGDATTRFSLTYSGQEREVAVDALGDSWSPEDVDAVAGTLETCEWVHVAPLLRGDFGPNTLAKLAQGRTLSLDGQGLVRSARIGRLELESEFDPRLLEHVSVLKLAEEEAAALTDDRDFETLLGLGVPEVVVTFGARGSLVLAGDVRERVHARRLPRDPTGAGDSFAAGYLAARADGADPVTAARGATELVAKLLEAR
jgi:sugar/nucleoside kinase (ribokinase family)